MIQFPSKEKNLLIQQGQLLDEKNREIIRGALPGNGKLVEATRHTIISGPPGVGKTFGTIEEAKKRNTKYVMLAPGMSDAELIVKLAVNVASLDEKEELVLIMDDADDIIFNDYATLNRWKIALADSQPDLGIIPTYNHAVSMTNTIASLRKQNRDDIADALEQFIEPDSIGISIPFDRVRVMILCNLDLEDPKAFSSKKIRSAVDPVLDRINYQRIDASWEKQWGWLVHVLSTTEPFEDYPIDTDIKKDLLNWMYANWNNLRSTSYRTVLKLAEDVINFPDNYESRWENKLKGH